MTDLLKRSKNFIVKTLLVITALCLLLLVVIQAFLLITINLLNTGKAKEYIQANLTTALAGSGYDTSFGKIFYDPVRGLTIYDLQIKDEQGVFLTADRLSTDIAFSRMLFRQINMVVDAGEIKFIRMPVTQAVLPQEQDVGLQPFTVPHLFFTSLNVPRLSIEHLYVGSDIAGQELVFSPRLTFNLGFGQSLALQAKLSLQATQNIGDVPFPETVSLKGEFVPSTLNVSIKEALVTSPAYHMDLKGSGQLIKDGVVDLSFEGAYPDLRKATQDHFQSAQVDIKLLGTYPYPQIQANGQLIPASLRDKGLSDIILSTVTENENEVIKTNLQITTNYINEPIKLAALLAYSENDLTLESLEGMAPHIDINGRGVLDINRHIFDGNIDLNADDLSYYKDLFGQDIAGALAANATLKSVNGQQTLAFDLSASRMTYNTLKLEAADIALKYPDLQTFWPREATINVKNLALSENMILKEVRALLENKGDEIYHLSLSGRGSLPARMSFEGGMDIADITQSFPTLRNINFKSTIRKSSLALTGDLSAENVGLELSTKDFRGKDIPADLPLAFNDARLSANILMSGSSADPETIAHLSADGFDTGQYKNLSFKMDANHIDNILSLHMNGAGEGIKTLEAQAEFPLTFALYPLDFRLNMDAPLSGNVIANMDLGAISSLFLIPPQEFTADLKADAKIAGTLSVPDIVGSIKMNNGQFTDEQNGIILRDMILNADVTQHNLRVTSLQATDGKEGRLSGSGAFYFANDSGTNLSLSMKKFNIPASNLANGIIDASLSFTDNNSGYAVNGAVDIEKMDIIIPETFQSKIPELNIVDKREQTDASSAQTLSLGIKVNAPNQIFVRGWGLDAEFGGDLEVTGDANQPLINGNLSSKRGRYEEFGKRFTLARANLRFQGEVPPSPYLDVEATVPANDITASIILAGPVKEPKITFSSVPSLPQDEVLARLLFGRDTKKITPFQAVQLAQALRRFSGQGGGSSLNPLEMLRSATGLDDISIDTDAAGDTNVGVGKYLTDKVYLEFEKGKAADSGGANIKIELTPSINVESEVGQDAQAGGGIFWKRDY